MWGISVSPFLLVPAPSLLAATGACGRAPRPPAGASDELPVRHASTALRWREPCPPFLGREPPRILLPRATLLPLRQPVQRPAAEQHEQQDAARGHALLLALLCLAEIGWRARRRRHHGAPPVWVPPPGQTEGVQEVVGARRHAVQIAVRDGIEILLVEARLERQL